MDPTPIRPSATDLERRRLETTIDHDLHSLSLSSLLSTTASSSSHPTIRPVHHNPHSRTMDHDHSTSFSSIPSMEYPRGETLAYPSYQPHHGYDSHLLGVGPHGTPRAAGRKVSGMSERSIADSPVSTAGHHVSAITLGDGVFRRPIGRGDGAHGDNTDEWDPERSFGRLVGELGKVMNGHISPRPTSPFSPPRSPRSPSPFSSIHRDLNLSYTLNRADPLPSPPASRSGSGSSNEGAKSAINSTRTGFSTMARDLANDLKANQKKVLGESNRHNINIQAPTASTKSANQGAGKDRLRVIQDESRRPKSAPARSTGFDYSADLTGMTGLLETPARGGAFGALDKNGDVGGNVGGGIGQSLATLHARLRALENENSLSRRRVRELEAELERAKEEVDIAKVDGDRRLREVIGEKSALEDLVKSLRAHLTRLTIELEQNKALVSELRLAQAQPPAPASPPQSKSVTDELIALRKEVERLGTEVHRLGGIVEQGLETRRKGRGEQSMRVDRDTTEGDLIGLSEEDIQRAQRDVEKRAATATTAHPPHVPNAQPSKLRQGLHQAASISPTLQPPSAGPPTRITHTAPTASANHNMPSSPTPTRSSHSHSGSNSSGKSRSKHTSLRVEGPSSPFPSIRAEDEEDFFEAAAAGKATTGITSEAPPWAKEFVSAPGTGNKARVPSGSSQGSKGSKQKETTKSKGRSQKEQDLREIFNPVDGDVPPQTVLARVIRELESDFAHYKAIYAELAEQYKLLDAASAVAKRHVLAEHLKEVIDTLEQKADQISSLYDLLTFSDRPLSPTERERNPGGKAEAKKSVLDILRMVKESLGEEGVRRLEEDGVVPRRRG